MMRSAFDDSQDNDPFYSHPQSQPAHAAPAWSQSQSTLQPASANNETPQWSQQQSYYGQQQSQQPDPLSGMTGRFSPIPSASAFGPTTASSFIMRPNPQLSGTMDRRHDDVNAIPSQGGGGSWLVRCTRCFRIEGYQPYFDLDTAEYLQRLQAALTIWWQPDAFRMHFLHETKPDLYAPIWITMTLIFVLAASSNFSAWISFSTRDGQDLTTSTTSQDIITPTFEYDITHLLHAGSALWTFVWVYPTLLWLACTCLGMPHIALPMWICVYGYAMAIYVPASLFCIMPWTIWRYIVLAGASFMSCLLVLRNLSSPLLSQDAINQAKASPILLSMMGAHFVWFLILKFRFFS